MTTQADARLPLERGAHVGSGTLWRVLAVLVIVSVGALIITRPRVANHFGYALPIANGLPCRLHYRGRDYENDDQCAGMNMSGWSAWYAGKHHIQSGGACQQPTELKRTRDWPLEPVMSVWTLFGPAHPVLVAHRDDAQSGFTTMGLYVKDGACYRPYVLLGGP